MAGTVDLRIVLLVDDDPMDVELTLAALEEINFPNEIVTVSDGQEALDYLYHRGKFEGRPQGDPMVVLLDNKMPKVTGLEVLKIIKDDDDLKSIPVVALTSSRETPDLVEFYKLGVNAYVVKPVNIAEFIKAIQQIGLFWAILNKSPSDAGKEIN